MDNPYEAPHMAVGPPTRPSKMVGHVPVVAILMMVQGGLEILMGLLYSSMAAIMPFALEKQAEHGGQQAPIQIKWMLYVYAALGLVVFVAAGIKIFAGWQNYRYRGRIIGFVALGSCCASLLGCYCFPTALALAIYGLIVYINDDVSKAFALAEQGYTSEQIRAAFENPPQPPG
jgi:hypothetical protein